MISRQKEILHILVAASFMCLNILFFSPFITECIAEKYPEKPIKLYIGHPPGGGSGRIAQIIIPTFKKYLPKPQPILSEFKPGASMAIAADFVLKQPKDGYSLFLVHPDLIAKFAKDADMFSFKLQDFVFIGAIGESPVILIVNSESPFKTLEDFLKSAKENPGKLSYASAGVASVNHVNGEVFQSVCGIKLRHVPFVGGAAMKAALMGKHVDSIQIAYSSVGASVFKPGGGLRALATFAKDRWPALSDTPTAFEKGYDIVRSSWYYLAAAKGTPETVLGIWSKILEKAAGDSDMKDKLLKQGFIPLKLSPAQTQKRSQLEFDANREIFKKAGLLK